MGIGKWRKMDENRFAEQHSSVYMSQFTENLQNQHMVAFETRRRLCIVIVGPTWSSHKFTLDSKKSLTGLGGCSYIATGHMRLSFVFLCEQVTPKMYKMSLATIEGSCQTLQLRSLIKSFHSRKKESGSFRFNV